MSTAKPRTKVGKALSAETWVFASLLIFFLIVAPAYHFVTHEVAGTVALTLSAVLNLILVVYLSIVGREVGKPRPEDDPDGEIVQGAGTLGFFPPKSIWPFWCALAITVIFLGPVFGWWISLIGFGVGVWATSGLVFEYYRGDYAH
ncbi:cytochrome c oxidase subunit 4 [Aestuariimicrobium soli]|uniref:cytochrome c oxidase subunit 4 n=1 Tax=Aestuariimicrobium soli TaxID=2035834 RepID=UPI003EBBFC11